MRYQNEELVQAQRDREGWGKERQKGGFMIATGGGPRPAGVQDTQKTL